MTTTTGMIGGGFYDAHSAPQRTAMQVPLAWLEAALADLPKPHAHSGAYTFLDAGSSEGANAIHAARRLLGKLRQGTTAPVEFYFDDVPTNDFNRLFANLYPDGGAAFADENVFTAAIGGSAFGRLLPPHHLHAATTFNAIGFLDRLPGTPLPGYVVADHPGAAAPRNGVGVTRQELAPFIHQAAEDLRHFYLARAAELLPGGKLLVQIFGRNGQYSTSQGIYDVLSDALLDAVAAGELPAHFYRDLIFPITCRTVEDLIAPLENDAGLAASYRVEESGSAEIPVPFNQELERNRDVAAWANAYTAFLRAFTEAIIAARLPPDMDATTTCEHLYQRVEQRLAAEPDRYPFHYISIAALLTRK